MLTQINFMNHMTFYSAGLHSKMPNNTLDNYPVITLSMKYVM